MLYQKMKKYKINSEGFTLLELMTVIAIIGILASAIMVSLSVQKKRAVVGRVLTEMSATMQNIYLCKSDDGTINSPDSTGGNDLCKINETDNPNYVQWPALGENEGLSSSYTAGGDFNGNDWYYGVNADTSAGGEDNICCNAKSGKCGKIGTVSCSGTTIIK
jgi:prepilin-type N-terminal cleavage/methylation domain-containing protein